MQQTYHKLRKSLLPCGLLLALSFYLLHWFGPTGLWESEWIHTVVEQFGVVAAWSLALLLLLTRRIEKHPDFYIRAVASMTAIGLLGLFHAVSASDIGLVLFDALTILVGGFLLSLVWLPGRWFRAGGGTVFPACVALGCIGLGLWVGLNEASLPVMMSGGVFTPLAKGLYAMGGAFFAAAAVRFLRHYDQTRQPANLWFTAFSLAMALIGLLSHAAPPWSAEWWFLMAIKLTAFVIGVVWAVRMFMRLESEMHATQSVLESVVALRTKELIGTNAGLNAEVAAHLGTHETLKRSEENLRMFIEATTQVVWNTDATGEVMRDSPSWRALTGQSHEAMQHRGWVAAYHHDDRPKVETTWRQAMETGRQFEVEARIGRRDGQYRDFLTQGVPVFDPGGSRSGWVGTCTDITERKRAESALRNSESQLRLLLDSTAEAICGVDMNDKVVFVNPACANTLGYGSSWDLLGKSMHELVHHSKADGSPNPQSDCPIYHAVIQGKGAHRDDEVFWRADGTSFPVEYWAHPIFREGRLDGAVIAFMDITARKRAEEQLHRSTAALAESEEKQKLILDTTTQGIYGVDLNGDCTFMNPAGARALGYASPGELIGHHIHTMIHHTRADGGPYPDSECRMYQAYRTGCGTHVDDECFWRADGTSFPVEYWSQAIVEDGRVTGAVAVFTDITQHRANEQSLQKSEAEYRTLFETSRDALFTMFPPDWKFANANAAAIQMFGAKDKAELAALEPWQVSPEVQPDGERSADKSKRMVETAMDRGTHLFMWTHKRVGGAPFPATVLLTRVELEGITGLLATVRDVSETEAAQTALRNSEVRYRRLFEAAQDGILILNAESGAVEDANAFLTQMLGYTRQELVGKHLWELGVFADIAASKEAFIDLQGKEYIRYEDMNLQARDGRPMEVEFISNVYTAGLVKVIQCNIRDVTDRKRAERQVLDQQRTLISILATTKDAVILVDDGENVLFWNAAAETIYGYTEQEAMGKELAALISPDRQHEFHRAEFRKFIAKGETAFTSRIRQVPGLRKDGTEVPVELSIAAVTLHGRPHAIVTIRDISGRLAADKEREKHAADVLRSMEEFVTALGAAVESRDPYTSGHQNRVSDICMAIAGELGLDAERSRGLKLGAEIHDIGKLHLPSDILNKPGRLTPLEFELVKTHAQAGYDIIKDVHFPWPIADMVHQHHERLDGSGYPLGLKAHEIRLESKIVGVADVVEAMTAHRPYRAALGLNAALEEITKGRGTKYDPAVVDACVKVMRREEASKAEAELVGSGA